MSTPKKPGTDLAALKARLAKKTKGAAAPPPGAPAPEPAPAAAPPPGAVPPPGQTYEPPPPEPAPEPVAAQPAYEQPAPMQPPMEAAAGGAPPMNPPPGDDPFGGGAGAFDPAEGVIDVGGEVPSRGNKGLAVFIFIGGMAFGGAVGWIGHNIVSKGEQVDVGKRKGAEMVESVQSLVDARQSVSLKFEEDAFKQKVATDPKAAAAEIQTLLKDKFDQQIKVDALFGWQLASVHPNGIKRTFQLYDEANRLHADLGYLGAYLEAQADALKEGGSGPGRFAVELKSDGAKLVGLVGLMCPAAGEGEGDGEGGGEMAPCTAENASSAQALQVIDAVGSEPRVVPLGGGAGQAMPLLPDGLMYQYAVGAEPKKNAVVMLNGQMKRIKEHLDAMAKAEKAAQKALSNYADSPTVDESTQQSDPEQGGE